jgi:hypothetical protein
MTSDTPSHVPIDRRSLVGRHRIELTEPHPEHVLSVGNGDFAFTADVTGMQTFTRFHDAASAMAEGRVAVNTATMSNWGWHEMPNPDGFTLDDAMTTYETARGPVSYPDKHDMMGAMTGVVADEFRAGAWLNANPQRLDLGRIGFELRRTADAEPEVDPSSLSGASQSLDLWTGVIDSSFTYQGVPVRVETVASPDAATVAFRIHSTLLTDGRARVVLRFPYASDGFFQTDDWDAADRHTSSLATDDRGATVIRVLDATTYEVHLNASSGELEARNHPHAFALTGVADSLELVVAFAPTESTAPLPSFADVLDASRFDWATYWSSGAAIDLSESTDPRAAELERRIVLSQYLTRVHGSGHLPPQETGLVTNSWQGKFHLEMHLWHAAHFAVWGRPELLERSLSWYLSVLDEARATAARQGYPGARWPKQTGPDGLESPSDIGSLLAWQQPHIIHMLELVWQASTPERREQLVAMYGELVAETATFMAAFAEERDGVFHLGAPIMPAQEFYDARTTTDPTFELAYWWWGLDVAQQWRIRAGEERDAGWQTVQDRLAAPLHDGDRYAAVATREPLRRDDHPSLLMALGVVPPTPLIDPTVMRATLSEVWETWEWPTAWGWDFPVLAMTAARLGEPALALDALLRGEDKNRYTAVGHNPQMRGILPLYLPGNGSLLLAVALLAQDDAAGFHVDGWWAHVEGFQPFPDGSAFDPTRVRAPLGPLDEHDDTAPADLTADTSIGQWLDHPVGGAVLRGFLAQTGTSAENLTPLKTIPLRQLVALSQGAMPQSAIDALVAAAASADVDEKEDRTS